MIAMYLVVNMNTPQAQLERIESVNDLRRPTALRYAVDLISNPSSDRKAVLSVLRNIRDWSLLQDKIYDITEISLWIIPGLVAVIKNNSKIIIESSEEIRQIILLGLQTLLNCSKQDDITEVFNNHKTVLQQLKNQFKNYSDVTEAIENLQRALTERNESKVRKFNFGSGDDLKEICLQIGELEQLGVGWKIWEGGLVLARWIQLNKDKFSGRKCLEVGAGCGLSGLLLGHYCKEIVLSDYTQKLVDNLAVNIKLNSSLQNASAVLLDWTDVHTKTRIPDLGKFDVIVGSEVLYLEDASISLAHTIDHYLAKEGLVVILSMLQKFRLGYNPFISELKSLGFAVTIEPVDESLINDFSNENNWVLITANRKRE